MYNITCFSPTVIYQSEINLDENISDYLDEMEFFRFDANDGFQSNTNYILKDSFFSKLIQQIKFHIEKYTKDVLKIDSNIKFEFTTSWIVKHQKGDFSKLHHHTNSVFSGIIYLKTPERCGNICFGKKSSNFPEYLQVYYDEYNIYNSENWCFVPKKGDIFLFPSSLNHYTGVNESIENRFCLVFNLFPVGKLYNGLGELVIK